LSRLSTEIHQFGNQSSEYKNYAHITKAKRRLSIAQDDADYNQKPSLKIPKELVINKLNSQPFENKDEAQPLLLPEKDYEAVS